MVLRREIHIYQMEICVQRFTLCFHFVFRSLTYLKKLHSKKIFFDSKFHHIVSSRKFFENMNVVKNNILKRFSSTNQTSFYEVLFINNEYFMRLVFVSINGINYYIIEIV